MNVDLLFDEKIFSKEAVLATCYYFADKIVAEITTSNGNISVSLKGRDDFVIGESTVDEFKTMLVHNQIRYQLKIKFSDLEKIIIEKAFRPVAKE